MLTFLSSLPLIGSILSAISNFGLKMYDAKLAADGARDAKVVELGARQIQLDALEARLNAQAKSEIRHIWWAPENLFAYIAVTYYLKVITVDNVLGSVFDLGWHTPFLTGATNDAMNMIMVFWLGKRGVENVASIISAVFGRR